LTIVMELHLTRASGDGTRYDLGPVGRLRLGGWGSRKAAASAWSQSWELVRRGLVPAVVDSTDVASDIVGAFRAKTFGRGDTLRWSGPVRWAVPARRKT
jgi:hypothetical protein